MGVLSSRRVLISIDDATGRERLTGRIPSLEEIRARGGVQPPAPGAQPHDLADSATIFVGIASYRDRRCGPTLRDAFAAARYPRRVFIGLVQQNGPHDLDCVEHMCELEASERVRLKQPPAPCEFRAQVRVTSMKSTEAAGPAVARHHQQKLIRDGDDFCLQCDAHSAFRTGWDVHLVREWLLTHNEFAVLTTYPPRIEERRHGQPYAPLGLPEAASVPHLCRTKVNGHGMFRNEQASSLFAPGHSPMLTSKWAAGFSFSKCHAERHVPNDPHLRYVWDGEEASRAARLWTNGYDFYTPSKALVYHDYSQDGTVVDMNVHRPTRDRANDRIGIGFFTTLAGVLRDSSEPMCDAAMQERQDDESSGNTILAEAIARDAMLEHEMSDDAGDSLGSLWVVDDILSELGKFNATMWERPRVQQCLGFLRGSRPSAAAADLWSWNGGNRTMEQLCCPQKLAAAERIVHENDTEEEAVLDGIFTMHAKMGLFLDELGAPDASRAHFMAALSQCGANATGLDAGAGVNAGNGSDPIASELRSIVNYVVLPKSVPQAASVVEEAQLDILVFPEIGMDAFVYFLAFRRMAPVQLFFWGHPVSPAIPTSSIDYFISSELFEPDEHLENARRVKYCGSDGACRLHDQLLEEFPTLAKSISVSEKYAEQAILMSSLTTHFAEPTGGALLATPHKTHLGFRETDHIYICPQTLMKFHPAFDIALSSILEMDPFAVVVIVYNSNQECRCFVLRSEWHRPS
eukprot:g1857.t1